MLHTPLLARPSFRLIVDLRALKDKVASQFYVLPTPDQVIFKLGHAKLRFLSSFDNKCGYFSQSIEEGWRNVTAITSSRVHYTFCRLPMGLKISSALYQQALSNLLADELDTNRCLIFQDDLILFNRIWDQHKKWMTAVFQKYDQTRVRFKALKSQVCVLQVPYLGYTSTKPESGSVRIVPRLLRIGLFPEMLGKSAQCQGLPGISADSSQTSAT